MQGREGGDGTGVSLGHIEFSTKSFFFLEYSSSSHLVCFSSSSSSKGDVQRGWEEFVPSLPPSPPPDQRPAKVFVFFPHHP